MKIYLKTDDNKRITLRHNKGARCAFANIPCPSCAEPLLEVYGEGRRREGDGKEVADAIADCCGRRIGTLVVEYDTLFGITEDEAVADVARAHGLKLY